MNQDTVLYLPALSNDPEDLVELQSHQEQLAEKLRRCVEWRLGNLDPLNTSIRERYELFLQVKSYLLSKEASLLLNYPRQPRTEPGRRRLLIKASRIKGEYDKFDLVTQT